MNFLAHYAVGSRPDDSLYTLGCILPDLIRGHRPGLRIKPSHHAPLNANPVELGVAHHYLADRRFHNSPFFKGISGQFLRMLKRSPFAHRRYNFFTAHIIVELLLDRVLMQRDVVLLDRFYRNLSRITAGDLFNSFHLFGLPDYEGFIPSYNRFVSSRYLYHYQNWHGLIFALNRIHGRVGLEPFDNQAVEWLVSMHATLERTGLSIIEDIASEIRPHE